MQQRFVWLLGGLVAAAVVVAMAVFLGGPGAPVDAGPDADPPPLTGRGVTADDLANPRPLDLAPVEVVRDFELFSESGDGGWTRFAGDEVSPQPDFVSDVVRPAAEVYFSPTRVLTITASSGRFHHPGNEPTRGEFYRDTVVTQYQAPPGQTLDLVGDRHVQFRLYLDELTRFDRETGRLGSDGPVRLVGPRVDFTGRGLDLTFNLAADRIERLVVTQGDQLRFAPTPRNDSAATRNRQNDTQPAATPQNEPHPKADPPQRYRVVLLDDLRIQVGSGEANLTGDRLDATFTAAMTDAADPPDTLADAGPRLHFVSARAQSETAPTPRGLMLPSPNDIVVRWSGRLELTPVDPTDTDPALGPGDAGLTLVGTPAVAETADGRRVAAATVAYQTAGETLAAQGSPAHPLRVNAPDLGTLTGRDLQLSQRDAVGHVTGPGRLATEDQQLDVTFRDRLNLTFTQPKPGSERSEDPDNPNALTPNLALDSATFLGDVRALATSDDPEQRLDLRSHSLALQLTPGPEGDPHPRTLVALADPDTPDQRVLATQPDTTFQARQLTLDLAPPKPGSERSEDPGPASTTPDLQVTRLRALGQVDVEIRDPDDGPTRLTAHALDADPQAKRLALFGENDQRPATLTRPDAELSGVHLILHETDQTADALGPGRFTARVDPDDPTARLNVAWSDSMTFDNAAGTARFLGDVRSNSASADDDTSLDAHRLDLTFAPQDLDRSPSAPTPPLASENSGGVLDLRLAVATADPDDRDDQVQFTAQSYAPPAPGIGPGIGRGVIGPNGDATPLTRVTLLGRELRFINQPPNLTNETPVDDNLTIEQVRIPTRGRMLLEDYRTPPEDKPADSGESLPGVDFAGRGLTLFAWEDQLVLDAHANDLQLTGDIFMLHRPPPAPGSAQATAAGNNDTEDDPPLKLNAERLTADLTETGGLGVFLAGDAPAAQIRAVTADGRVRVAQGTSNLESDRMVYTESNRSVLFTALPRKQVQLTLDGRLAAPAAAYRWDLDQNLFTAIEPRNGVIPIE